MRRGRFYTGLAVVTVAFFGMALAAIGSQAQAENQPGSDVTIRRFKVISGDQYVELQNNTDTDIDMSGVQLAYYNNYDIAAATTSRLITLSGTLPARGLYLVNDSATVLCYRTAVASASLGFATGSGRLLLTRLDPSAHPSNPFAFKTLDFAAWYRGSAVPPADVVKFPATSDSAVFALRQWAVDEDGVEEARAAGGGTWLQSRFGTGDDACVPLVEGEARIETYGDYELLPGALPPVRYVAAVTTTGSVNRNIGKMAPVLSELLPNPASPQTDANDEFIELYNPNDSVFDLSGFKLAFGGANPRKYTIPEGTVMQPNEFKVFMSGGTSISLSNSAAQVWLLDPNEKVISKTDPYSNAKDGQAWALDSNTGTWTWTLQPTPGEANALTPQATAGSKPVGAVLGIESGTAGGSDAAAAAANATLDDTTPLHPLILAAVGLGAVAYGIYEYRQDIANRIFQFRRYLRNRQAVRKPVQGR